MSCLWVLFIFNVLQRYKTDTAQFWIKYSLDATSNKKALCEKDMTYTSAKVTDAATGAGHLAFTLACK